jgi:hypothetical protein
VSIRDRWSRFVAACRRALAGLRAAGTKALSAIDAQDVHIYGGLAIATIGGCYFSVPITMIALGLALVLLGRF